MRFFCLVTFLVLTTSLSMSQPVPCSEREEADQLDFWVGEWDLSWTATGDDPGKGTNTITRELDGCVIHERFSAENGFDGESVSVYNPRTEQWQQTWVDNQGGYLLFTGTLTGDEPQLRSAPVTNAQGEEQISRMTWRNITEDALDWHWQRSTDGGETWEDVWVIHYTRRAD